MKNRGIYCLLTVCLMIVAFSCGFFFGRNANHSTVQISGNVTQPSSPAPSQSTSSSHPSESGSQGILNINTATVEQLQTLPGIGPVLAQRIVDYRDANGNFSSIADLTNVPGIGDKRLTSILNLITV